MSSLTDGLPEGEQPVIVAKAKAQNATMSDWEILPMLVFEYDFGW
jgi:hypothetical protein